MLFRITKQKIHNHLKYGVQGNGNIRTFLFYTALGFIISGVIYYA